MKELSWTVGSGTARYGERGDGTWAELKGRPLGAVYGLIQEDLVSLGFLLSKWDHHVPENRPSGRPLANILLARDSGDLPQDPHIYAFREQVKNTGQTVYKINRSSGGGEALIPTTEALAVVTSLKELEAELTERLGLKVPVRPVRVDF